MIQYYNYGSERLHSDTLPCGTVASLAVTAGSSDDPADPGDSGFALGEEFSYEVNVYDDVMSLTFSSPGKETKQFDVNLADEDFMYFQAGAYNHCSTADAQGIWYAACPGTGELAVDKANGDYASATFSELVLSEPTMECFIRRVIHPGSRHARAGAPIMLANPVVFAKKKTPKRSFL